MPSIKITRRKLIRVAPLILAAPAIIRPSQAAFVSFGVNGSPINPWPAVDGSPGAPAGTAQFPTLLNSYGPTGFTPGRYTWPSIAAFNVTNGNFQQPQWKVAGVDYAVGPDSAYGTSIPFKVPGTDALPSGATFNGTNRITIGSSNVTLDGWDLTQGSGQGVLVSAANATISNCKFLMTANTTFAMIDGSSSSASGLFITKCFLNSNGFTDTNSTAMVLINTGTCTYSLLQYAGSDVFHTDAHSTSSNVTTKYNVVLDAGQEAGTHPDWLSVGVSGTGVYTFDISFNLLVQHNTLVGSQPFVLGTDNGNATQQGDFNNNTELSLNSATAGPGTGTQNLNNLLWITAAEAARGTGFNVLNNFFDPTVVGSFGGGGGFFTSNINMLNGTLAHANS
jgi:hypothetical protein